jgi:hypothetical protein
MTMHKNARKEPFRYQFTTDFACVFKILEINEKQVSTKLAEATMLDMSKSGCKLATPLNLNSVSNKLKLSVTFQVEDREFSLPGFICWQNNSNSNCFYGIHFEIQEQGKQQILDVIRALASDKKVVAK